MTNSIFRVGQRLTDGVNVDVLVERVASGGFGEVAMGQNRVDEGRWSAIKVLRADLLTRQGLQPGSAAYAKAEARLHASFLQEALTWLGLWPHLNLLTAQFVTQINGQLMLVLDFAEQGSLRDLFISVHAQGGWFTLDIALDLAQQIATGLVALHTPAPDLLRAEPIVHRDLKPENILLSHRIARITDFGLARAVTQATQVYHSQRGAVLGTPAYMAPEQWLDASQASQPADAYAFGLLVCELITGHHPLLSLDQRHTLEQWQSAHLTGQPTLLHQLGAAVFTSERASRDAVWGERHRAALGQVDALVARLLTKLPAARPTLVEALKGLRTAAEVLGERGPYTPGTVSPTEEHRRIFWQGWADAFKSFGLYEEALPRIERALTLAPQHPAVLTTYAATLARLRRVEEALEVAQQALAQTSADDQPRRAMRLNNIGNYLNQMRRYAEAEAAFAEALRLDPTHANAWHNRACNAGMWAEAEGQVEAAQTQAEAGLAYSAEALRLNPDHTSYSKVAQALLQLREELGRQGEARAASTQPRI